MNLRDFLILYTEILEFILDFPSKQASDRLPGQLARKSWVHKIHKREGAALKKKFQNPYFAHNSAPVRAEVCEIKTTPPESIIFQVHTSSNGQFGGFKWPNRAELLFIQGCKFFGRKKVVFFRFPRVRMASPGCQGSILR